MFHCITVFKRAIIIAALALLALIATSCATEPTQTPTPTSRSSQVEPTTGPTPDLSATVSAAIAATTAATPTDTPVPTSTIAPTPTPIPAPRAQLEASATEGQSPFTVDFTNLSENADAFQWDFGDGSTSSSTIGVDPVTHEYTKAGTYQITLTALKGGQTDSASMATVSITVEPGPLFEVTIEPDALTTVPVEEHLFTVISLDQFGNEISGLSYDFGADDKVGEVEDTGKFTAGTLAGTYPAAVSVEVAQGSVAKSVSVDITIEHGALDHILLTPKTVELGIGEDQKFSAVAVDVHGNPISKAQIDWDVNEAAGTITGDGTLSAGTLASTFEEGVKATALFGDATAEANAAVTVKPDSPATLSIVALDNIAAGSEQQLAAVMTDRYDNPVKEVKVSWTALDPNVGSITPSGLLAAGEVAGTFLDAVEVQTVDGERSAKASLTIVPGDASQVVVAPNLADIGIGMTQQFVAVAADQYGNRISGVKFTWRVEQRGGAIKSRVSLPPVPSPAPTTIP